MSQGKIIDGKLFLQHLPAWKPKYNPAHLQRIPELKNLRLRKEAEALRLTGYYARVINGRIYIRPKNMPKKYSMTIPKDAIPPKKLRWIETRPNTLSTKGKRAKTEAARYIYYTTKVLDQPPPTTGEILEHLNEKYQHGYTSNQVGNFLSKDPRFRKEGVSPRPHRQTTWALTKP
jgi:hypothetical protein